MLNMKKKTKLPYTSKNAIKDDIHKASLPTGSYVNTKYTYSSVPRMPIEGESHACMATWLRQEQEWVGKGTPILNMCEFQR